MPRAIVAGDDDVVGLDVALDDSGRKQAVAVRSAGSFPKEAGAIAVDANASRSDSARRLLVLTALEIASRLAPDRPELMLEAVRAFDWEIAERIDGRTLERALTAWPRRRGRPRCNAKAPTKWATAVQLMGAARLACSERTLRREWQKYGPAHDWPNKQLGSGLDLRVMTTPRNPNGHEVVRIAAEAITSPQTVRRFVDGQPMRSTTSTRIREALERMGLGDFIALREEHERKAGRG